jgi:hypothetical protein
MEGQVPSRLKAQSRLLCNGLYEISGESKREAGGSFGLLADISRILGSLKELRNDF